MNLSEFIEEVFQQGMELWGSAEQLRYRAPKGVLTPELKDKLRQHKEKILACLPQRDTETAIFFYPLSFAQKTFWFLYQLAPSSVAYNMPFAVRIRSEIDISAFRNALQSLVDRHHAFRTTYTTIDGGPVQLLHEHQQVSFEVIDASTWSQEYLHERLHEEATRPFDLEQGPVLRAHLFPISTKEHLFLLTVHHIALDLWSLEVVIDELGTLYAAEMAGVQSPLPPLELQYKDYVRWQLQMLPGTKGDQLRAYWQAQLSGELPVLNLPTDRPRPPVQTYNTDLFPFTFDKELSEQIKTLAKAEKTSLYTILVTTFFVLLYRYTGQEDILLGAPTSGRSQTKFQGIAGYFVNPVVLRADFSGNPPLKEFLHHMHHQVLTAFDHQDYPSHLLPDELRLDHDPGHPQLFQAIFMLQELHRIRGASSLLTGKTGVQIEIGGLTMEPVDLEEGTMIFVDLLLMMYEEEEQISASWQYNTDLFDAAAIQRMAEHFHTLLKGIVANPELPLSEFPILTEAERHQLLGEWNDTKVEYPDHACIHQLFEKQVAQTPDATALVFSSLEPGEQTPLTYRELNQKSNQLAHYLRSLNIGAEVLVGVCMKRSIEMVAALLGILKAGGAYMPIDPSYPEERLAFMLEDSQVPVLLTQQRLLENLPKHEAHTICLDTEWGKIADRNTENLECHTCIDNLAYMIYTSGSTGKPKGVMLSHRGLLNLCEVQKRAFNKFPESRVLQFASFSFDASVSEVFVTFLAGATLYITPQNDLMPGPPLSQTLRKNEISVVTLPPSALTAMEQEEFPHLHTIVSAGEACTAEIVKRWQPGRLFLNAYGPTEGTVCATINEHITPEQASSIGKAIANTQIYILDEHLQPVPIGVPGELCFGGISLARGYLNRQELTAEKFIPNPFSDEPGTRVYRTGDLACYLPDGNIEFLGRIDYQVKIRGYRIELGEIEEVLNTHPDARETVVLAKDDKTGKKQLVAYVVPEQKEREDALEPQLRSFLQDKLPNYMVPSAFVLLETFPLTPNGKVDRRALPEPDRSRRELEKTFVAPRSSVEEILAEIWSEILDVEQIGVHDDFFEVGGNSLMVIQILSRVRDTFQVELPLHRLFEIQTIEDLAIMIEEKLIEEIEQLNEEEVQNLM